MMVTMLFTLNPGFVDMIEKAINVVIARSSAKGRAQNSDNQVAAALTKLTISGEVTPRELRRTASFDANKELSLSPEARRFSYGLTPTEVIGPSDSVSAAALERRREPSIREKDIQAFINRKRIGMEPEFRDVFKSAREPVAVDITDRKPWDKTGLGHSREIKREFNVAAVSNLQSDIARVLGGLTTKSVDYDTGEVVNRAPRVEDFLDSEEPSQSVFKLADDLADEIETTLDLSKVERAVPTEYSLPTTLARPESYVSTAQVVKEKDSFELLLAKAGYRV